MNKTYNVFRIQISQKRLIVFTLLIFGGKLQLSIHLLNLDGFVYPNLTEKEIVEWKTNSYC